MLLYLKKYILQFKNLHVSNWDLAFNKYRKIKLWWNFTFIQANHSKILWFIYISFITWILDTFVLVLRGLNIVQLLLCQLVLCQGLVSCYEKIICYIVWSFLILSCIIKCRIPNENMKGRCSNCTWDNININP